MMPMYEDDLKQDFIVTEQPTKTYRFHPERNTVSGYTEGADAMKQAIYLILQMERYIYPIYSWNYGTELQELIGEASPLVYAKIRQNITEALMQDNRILQVSGFVFEKNGSRVQVRFTAGTIFGDIETKTEVETDV